MSLAWQKTINGKFFIACDQGDLQTFRSLLKDHGSEIDVNWEIKSGKDENPINHVDRLCLGDSSDRVIMLKELIEFSKKYNKGLVIHRNKDVDEQFPLHSACFFNNLEMVKFLISEFHVKEEREEFKLNLNCLRGETTPLGMAVYKCSREVVEELLKYPNIKYQSRLKDEEVPEQMKFFLDLYEREGTVPFQMGISVWYETKLGSMKKNGILYSSILVICIAFVVYMMYKQTFLS